MTKKRMTKSKHVSIDLFLITIIIIFLTDGRKMANFKQKKQKNKKKEIITINFKNENKDLMAVLNYKLANMKEKVSIIK